MFSNSKKEQEPLLVTSARGSDYQYGTSDSSLSISAPPPKKGTSWVFCAFLLANGALGSSVLNYPQAFHQAGGIVPSIIMQLIVLMFVIPALVALITVAEEHKCTTYQAVVEAVCGKVGLIICSVCIVLYCYFISVTLVIVIGDQFDRILASYFGPTFCADWYMDRNFTMCLTCFLFCLPMCFSKSMDFLKHSSTLGVFSMSLVIAVVIDEFFKEKVPAVGVRTSPRTLLSTLNVLPNVCFGFQFHVYAVPTFACMQPRGKNPIKDFAKAAILAASILIVVYDSVAAVSYLQFGKAISSNILKLYDAEHPLVMTAMVAFMIKIYTTYPITLFSAREGFLSLVGLHSFLARSIVVVVMFVTTVLIAVVIPNITVIIRFLGCLAALFIMGFPGLCYFLHVLDKDPMYMRGSTKWKLVFSTVLMLLGAGFIFGQVFAKSTIQTIFGTDVDPRLCVLNATAAY